MSCCSPWLTFWGQSRSEGDILHHWTRVSLLLRIPVLSWALSSEPVWLERLFWPPLSRQHSVFWLVKVEVLRARWSIPLVRTCHDKLVGATQSRPFISRLLMVRLTWPVACVDGLRRYPFCQCAGSPTAVYLQSTKPQNIDSSLFKARGNDKSETDRTGFSPPNRPSKETSKKTSTHFLLIIIVDIVVISVVTQVIHVVSVELGISNSAAYKLWYVQTGLRLRLN